MLTVLFIFCFAGCKDNIDTASTNKVITHIEANELDNALTICQTMNEATLKASNEKILKAVIKKLNYYLNYDNWTSTKFSLVDNDAIKTLKVYKDILSILVYEDTFTNTVNFVSNALKLEEYTIWNDFYKINDDYLTEAQGYMNQGAPYRNTNWDIAVIYYEKAYTVANNAYLKFNGYNTKGMKESANFYKAYSTLIKNTIDKKDTSSTEGNAYNNAASQYATILQEYSTVLSDVIAILESFPSKLY